MHPSSNNRASAGAATPPAPDAKAVSFANSECTTSAAARSTPGIPSSIPSSAFSKSSLIPPPPSRRRLPQLAYPEEVIASRYLHRLGNVFIRSSLNNNLDDSDELTSDDSTNGEDQKGIPKESIMRVESRAHHVLSPNPIRTSIIADLPDTRGDGKRTSSASANHRMQKSSGACAGAQSNVRDKRTGGLDGRSGSIAGRGATTHMFHSNPLTSRSTSGSGSSISGDSVATLENSERGSQSVVSPSARRHVKKVTVGSIATANADALLAEAAAVMAAAVPPHRELRGEKERFMEVLGEEHTKMILLVGRHSNVESDIIDMVEVAEAAKEKAQQEGLHQMSRSTSGSANRGGTKRSSKSGKRTRRSPGRTTLASLPDLESIRLQLETKRKDFFRNCGTDFDTTHLHQLVGELDSGLGLMETVLEEELYDLEAADSQEKSPAPKTRAPESASPSRPSVRQRVQQARWRRADILEASSNIMRMEWLLESVGEELLTDFQQPQPTDECETRSLDTATEVGGEAHRQSLLTVGDLPASSPAGFALHQSSVKDAPNFPSSPLFTSTTTATSDFKRAGLDPHALHRLSLTTTICDPSMVPFTLSDSPHDGNVSEPFSATATSTAVAPRQQGHLTSSNSKGIPLVSSQSTDPASGLNLLKFMSEMLAQYHLERVHPEELRKGRPVSAPTVKRDYSPASQLAGHGHVERSETDTATRSYNGSLLEASGMTTADERDRRSAAGSMSGARRTSLTFSGVIPGSSDTMQSFGTGNIPGRLGAASSDPRWCRGGTPSTTASQGKSLLGAELRNLRPGLLHDLYELCMLHNYVQLIEARRREISKGATKGDAEYAAEMEEKLAEHRRQLEAIQRAREEAERREAEAKAMALQMRQKNVDGRRTRQNKLGSLTGPIRPDLDDESEDSLSEGIPVPRESSVRADKKPSEVPTRLESPTPRRPAVQQPVAAQLETELLREILPGTGLVFTIVGVHLSEADCVAGSSNSARGATAAAAEAGAGAVTTQLNETHRSAVLSEDGESNSFHHYVLRVERPLSDSPPPSTDPGSLTSRPTTASSIRTVAAVTVASHRLRNLTISSGSGVSVKDDSSGRVMKVSVAPGAPPRLLMTLTPAKPGKGVSYDEAFSFSADGVTGSAATRPKQDQEMQQMQQDQQSWREGWDADPPLPSLLEFPLGGLGLKETVHGSSLDSHPARSSKGKKGAKGDKARAGRGASKAKRGGEKRGSSDSARLRGSVSRDFGDHGGELTDAASPTSRAVTEDEKAVNLKAQASLYSPDARSKADEGLQRHSGRLPHTPPLSSVPRPIGEWGVPHAREDMEALEKNAVVLAVLQAGEGYAAETAALSAGVQGGHDGGGLSAVEKLLAVIPDSKIGGLAEGQQSPGTMGFGSHEDGGRGMMTGLMAPGSGASLVANAIAEEIASQAMMGDDGEGEALGKEGMTGPGGLAGEDEMGTGYSQRWPAVSIGKDGSKSSFIGSDEAAAHGASLFPETDSEGRPLSSALSQQQDQSGGGRKSSVMQGSLGEFTIKESKSKMLARFRRARESTAKSAMTQSPFYTTSSSQPPHGGEAAEYSGGPARPGHSGDAAADAPSTSSLKMSANQSLPSRREASKKPLKRGAAITSSAVKAGTTGEPSVSSAQFEQDNGKEDATSLAPPPVMVVKGTPGCRKPYILLPQQAAASSLGPSLRNKAGVRPAKGTLEKRTGHQAVGPRGGLGSNQSAGESSTTSLPLLINAENSVLPTAGAAAAIAVDVETVSHVKNFLESVKDELRSSMMVGGGLSGQAGARHSTPAAGGALLTELSELQEDARELFMMDPERFDTVISELMNQAASTLQQGCGRDTSLSSGYKGMAGTPANDVSQSGSLPPLRHGHSPGAGSADEMHLTPFASGDVSFAQGKSMGASLATHESLPQLQTLAEYERGRDNRGEGGLQHWQAHPGDSAGLSPLPSHGVASSIPCYHFEGRRSTFRGADVTIDEQFAFSSSLQPATAGPRRDTHTFLRSSVNLGDGEDGALFTGDAVTEVERILHEQLKAQVLLRAIIQKMKQMWKTKRNAADAKRRERLAYLKQRFMQRTMAAAWSVERQRVVHLHKLIYLLDRRVGRVHGWLPHYADSNILMDGYSFDSLPRNMGTTTMSSSARAHAPLASWYRQREQISIDAAQDSVGGYSGQVCPRYLYYLPQRRMYCYMRLVKLGRMLPLRLVRAGIHQSHNQHLLLGYNKIVLGNPDEETGDSNDGSKFNRWPQRRLPRRRLDYFNNQAAIFSPDRLDDMKTSGERLRYQRRLQRTAAFQKVSKMFSPREKCDSDFPFPVL